MEISDISLAKAAEDTLTGVRYNLTLGSLTIEQVIEVLKALRASQMPEPSEPECPVREIPDCGVDGVDGTAGTAGGHWYYQPPGEFGTSG